MGSEVGSAPESGIHDDHTDLSWTSPTRAVAR